MPSDLEVIKGLIADSNKAFEQFKAKTDQELAELAKTGRATPETAAEVERINAAVTNFEAKIAEMETRLARPSADDGDETLSPQAEENKSAFFAYLRDGHVPREFKAALVEDGTGEILVPEDMETEIRRSVGVESVMRQLARVRPTTRNRVRRRSLNDVTVGWGKLELGAPLAESTLVPSDDFIYVEDLRGLTKIGEDELDDTDVNLETEVDTAFSRAVTIAEDGGFTIGTGHGDEEPEGVFTEGNNIPRVPAGQNNTIKADDLITLEYAVPAAYRPRGKYLLPSTTEQIIRKLKDSQGQFLWQPSVQQGRPRTFNGYEIYNQDNIPAIPAGGAGSATPAVAFGDFYTGYLIVDRLGMTVKRLNEAFALQGLVGFLVRRRVGGGVAEPNALRILVVPRA